MNNCLKVLGTILLCFVLNTNANAQFVTLPDTNFRNWIDVNFPGAIVGGQLNTQDPGITSAITVNCSFNNPPLVDITGIGYFSSLLELDCSNNMLTFVPNLNSGLVNLLCGNNQITWLPALPGPMGYFHCVNNQLSSLPVLPNSIDILHCYGNNLTTLPTLPTNTMTSFDCSNNQLTSLPPVIPATNVLFSCAHNNIDFLPNIPSNTKGNVWISHNQIPSLPELPSGLQELWCDHNPIDCLPTLPDSLFSLDVDGTNISCVPNIGFQLNTNLPLCPVQGVCTGTFNISGDCYIDDNSNGVFDNGEDLIDQVSVQLQPDNYAVGAANGSWSYNADTGTSYTCTAMPQSPYYTIVPDSHTVLINAAQMHDSTLHFGLQSTGVYNDLKVDISLLLGPRPGFNTLYRVICENVGTTALNARLDFNYGALFLTHLSSTITPDSLSGNFAYYSLGVIPPLGKVVLDLRFHIDPSMPLGGVLGADAFVYSDSVDATPSNNSDTDFNVLIGSYDPNDKIVSDTAISTSQVLAGEWLEYLIRFQNTGTASAINVRLQDSISANLDLSTFDYISASHPNNWYLSGNELVVAFDSILLPDSNANEPESHGYFKYKLRVVSTLMPGEQVPNFADIYFDYNAPVRTNTVVTEYVITTGKEQAENTDMHIYPNPNNGILNVEFSDISAEKQLLVRSIDGRELLRRFARSGEEHVIIDTQNLSHGIYLLELLTENNRNVVRFVK